MSASTPYYIGLISGTSVDGIDAAIIDTSNKQIKVVKANCYPLPETLTESIQRLCNGHPLTPDSINKPGSLTAKTHRQLGIAFAAAVTDLLDQSSISSTDITAIGSHGQTVWHQPPSRDNNGRVVKNGYSVQIGCPKVIEQQTGITVVSDFRSADMASGGEGAPLAPAFHAAIAHQNETAVFLNLGGIANITLVHNGKLICGYDTGPANTLMDAWIKKHQGKPYDKNGEWAASGKVDKELLSTLLADPYFELPAPKSTGREYFHLEIDTLRKQTPHSPQDVQATLLALTANSIANEINKLSHRPSVIYCCGGGSHNGTLMALLSELLPGIKITTTQTLGIDPDYVEAALFAWLAKKHIEREAVDVRAVTGANKASVLGVQVEQ